MTKSLSLLALAALAFALGFLSLNAAFAHDGSDEVRQTMGMMDMHMGSVQKMMLSNLGQPGPDYDLRYMALLLGQEKAALKLSQAAAAQALKPEVKQLAMQQTAEHTARIEQLETRIRLWFTQ